jgi:hypothetical protein
VFLDTSIYKAGSINIFVSLLFSSTLHTSPGERIKSYRFIGMSLSNIYVRGPLSLVSKIEELLGRNSSGSGPVTREYSRGDPLS